MAYVTFERLLRYKDKSKLHKNKQQSCHYGDKLRKEK